MGKFLSKKFLKKEGYHLGESLRGKNIIKINANESPYPPSLLAIRSVTDAILAGQNLYADPQCTELRKAAAAYYSLEPEQVFVDSGSDVILAYCMIAYNSCGEGFCFPDVTYNFYKTFSEFFSLQYQEIPVQKDFSICVDDYCHCCSNVMLANPNAPTGLKIPLKDIERILLSNPDHLVVIDEAYVDFGNETCVPLINQYDNLMVIHTMSKSHNLAGARIGLAFSSAKNIDDLALMKAAFNPDSLNTVSQVLGCAALQDTAYTKKCVHETEKVRDAFRRALLARKFAVLKSNTNFLFVKPLAVPAEYLYRKLKENGILIRYYDQPRIRDYVRISIGTEEQMHIVIQAIDKIVSDYKIKELGNSVMPVFPSLEK